MAATPKDLLAIVAAPGEFAGLAAAESLSRRWTSHLTVLHLAQLPDPVGVSPSFGSDLWSQTIEEARKESAAERAVLERWVAERTPEAELKSVEVLGAAADAIVTYTALHTDLTILASGTAPAADAAFEAALFKSGRPVLVMPREWSSGDIGSQPIIAWNGKREAARAVADAAPFLQEAKSVHVVTVDAQPAFEGAPAPGVDIAAHLTRRGLKVDLRQVDGEGASAESIILQEARAVGADLIVMGGFGHSRLRQFVFGGVTRALWRSAPLPLLMSH